MRQVVLMILFMELLGPLPLQGATVEELEEQVKALNEKIEQVKREREEQKKAEVEPAKEARQPFYREALERVRVGGYGSIRFESNTLDEVGSTFTFRRFVLTTDATPADRLKTYFELEFERFQVLEVERTTTPAEGGLQVQQAVEATPGSEIAIEQAWVQYDITDWLKFRGGAVLVPLGRFNTRHDDNLWALPRRSLVDRGVPVLPIPAAWPEVGMGFTGDLADRLGRLSYELYVMNGATLDAEVEEIIQTREGKRDKLEAEVELRPSRGTAQLDPKDGKAMGTRVAWTPLLGQELGASLYFGRYTPGFLDDEKLLSFGLDGLFTLGPFELEWEYVNTHFGKIRDVAESFAKVAREQSVEIEKEDSPDLEVEIEFELAQLAKTKQGYWLELRHRFWPPFLNQTFLGKPFENPQFVAVARWEQAFLNDRVTRVEFTGGTITSFETEDRWVNRITAGLAYKPTPLWAFQLAYEYTWTNKGKSLAEVTNFLPARLDEDRAHAFLFGVAFGF